MKTRAVLALPLAFFISHVYATDSITYTDPIENALPPVKGKTLKRLTTDSTPDVPPFDKVDVSQMKCSSCHQPPNGWDAKALCNVAKIFSKNRARIDKNPSKGFKVKHPFNLHLKKALASWADTGCLDGDGGIGQVEKKCYNFVQGNIAWDANKANTRWKPKNVETLCKKAKSGKHAEPGLCYAKIQGVVAWNKQGNKRWDWKNVVNLCKGSRNSHSTVSCFKRNMKEEGWSKATKMCKS